MNIRIAGVGAAMIALAVLGSSSVAMGEEPFVFRLLPSEKCTMTPVSVPDPQLTKVKCNALVADSCSSSGGSLVVSNGAPACRLPGSKAAQFDRKIGQFGNGPTFPDPAGSSALKGVSPGGCVLRPENPFACGNFVIDRTNTADTCRSIKGTVVTTNGVSRCQLPKEAGSPSAR
jgi:hypothetical protein